LELPSSTEHERHKPLWHLKFLFYSTKGLKQI